MATFLTDENEIYKLYDQAESESLIWRQNYHEYERLADNDLMEDLDENLPEVNDGSLAASLFKLPKRVVNTDLKGRAKSTSRDDGWVTELANIVWENKIVPNANSQAPFHRKWKDAVRKSAIYGSVPLITLFVERGNYIGADFIVVQPQDVMLEPGKVSDYDSDIIFWEVYYTKLQVERLIERAKEENKQAKDNPEDAYNKWDIQALKDIVKADEKDGRDANNDHNQAQGKGVKRTGIKFCVVFQRGVDAPFYMYHKGTKKIVREWSNPDPTGDIPVHFLYCYQDFVNPYGVGIVKLAGGTQNVLDYMRQSDVLATQLGLRPPIKVMGPEGQVDTESLVYAQDAQWYVGDGDVERQELSNQIYQQLPERISMYKTSLNQLIPVGDTSITSGAGDPNYSRTPAGVKFQEANLSIDDEDYKDNLYITYEAVARSMINTHFANMQGSDLMKLSDEERDMLIKAGMDWPTDETGNLIETNELEVLWDEARSEFDYEMDAEQDKAKDDEKRLDALLKVAEFRNSDPNFDAVMMQSGKKLNIGELYADIIHLTSDNDKIIEDVTPEDQQAMAEEEAMVAEQEQPQMGQQMPAESPVEDDAAVIEGLMQQYGVDESTAMAMREAERQGYDPDEILAAVERKLTAEAGYV